MREIGDFVRTREGFTDTAEGRVRHLRVVIDQGVLDAPVMLWPRLRGESGILMKPRLTLEGRYLHALPGGGVIAGSRAPR